MLEFCGGCKNHLHPAATSARALATQCRLRTQGCPAQNRAYCSVSTARIAALLILASTALASLHHHLLHGGASTSAVIVSCRLGCFKPCTWQWSVQHQLNRNQSTATLQRPRSGSEELAALQVCRRRTPVHPGRARYTASQGFGAKLQRVGNLFNFWFLPASTVDSHLSHSASRSYLNICWCMHPSCIPARTGHS
jgi:hypothetical protein